MSRHSPYVRSQFGSPLMGAGPPINGNGTNSTASAEMDEAALLQDETLYFEWNRIRQLKDERRDIQKKTFTKWCNSYLSRARLEINDLFTDLGDGIMLMKFLEIISGEKLGKPNRGRMRVQKIENLNRCLEFLKHKRIQLENIGAEDIADGNERLILGLIWTIILRFTIENIEIETKESGERKHAKEALLLWCQRKTAGYPNVRIDNFSSSWRSGLAFCALIHAHHPELLNFDGLNPQDPLTNLNLAFDIAERKLDIARLLDAEDVNVACPDEKSVITYVSLFYHSFAKQKSELTGARRVAKVVGELVQQDRLQEDWEQMASDLLAWILARCRELADRQFPNSLGALREMLAAFNRFRKEEKPPKYKEKGELEAQFFAIQTKRTASRRKPYQPPEGLGLHDLASAWAELERTEHARQGALIAELQRQERLELRAQLFHKKADVRDAWLCEMTSVLGQFEGPPSEQNVEAAVRLLRNISAEALPKTDRFALLTELSAELQRENFHGAEQIRARERDILRRWNAFLTVLAQTEAEFGRMRELSTLLAELDTLGEELAQMAMEMKQRAQETGKHLAAVDELLRKHELAETNVRAKQEWLAQLAKRARDYARTSGSAAGNVKTTNGNIIGGAEQLAERLKQREQQLDGLQAEARQRRATLQRAREFFQFIGHWEEQKGWLADRLAMCRQLAMERDLGAIGQGQRAHKMLEAEMALQWERTKLLIADGERLGQPEEIHWRLEALQRQWEELRAAHSALQGWLSEADRLQQYFQDANEAESWIRERVPLARSDDVGRDQGTAESQWRRHRQLEKEIQAYKSEIQRLEGQAHELEALAQFTLNTNGGGIGGEENGEGTLEGEGNDGMEVAEELIVPKVLVLYPYSGGKASGGISVARDEELALLDATNKDWWRVLSRTGQEGYVPANYCELVPDETVTVTQPSTAQRKHSTKISNQIMNGQNGSQQPADGQSGLAQRQKCLAADYRHLCGLAEKRGRALEEAINLFKFFAECRDFETWAKQMGQSLQEPVEPEHHLLPRLQEKFQKVRDEIQGPGQAQLQQLSKMGDQLLAQGHSRAKEVLTRKERAIQLWAQLQKGLERKSAELDKAQRLWQFNEQCEDTRAWLAEKRVQLQREPGNGQQSQHAQQQQDLRALQAAQRRLQNLERDLRPLADRMKALWVQAEQIAQEQPERGQQCRARVQELEAMHAELLAQARTWIEEAERSQGQQMFEQAAKELLDWTEKCREQMLMEPLSGTTPAEEVLRRHAEVREQIEGKQFEFGYVEELGRRLVAKGQPRDEVEERLRELERARAELEQQWQSREADCRQLLDWQAFSREADRIDSLSRGQLAFLELPTATDSVEKVQNLLKGQSEFEARISAQEERVLGFTATAQRLTNSGHGHSAQIEQQRMEVLRGHQHVLDKAEQRRMELERALALEGLRRDAGELKRWMGNKGRQMGQQKEGKAGSGGGLLHWEQHRHQAFVLELAANRAEMARLKKVGAEMVYDGLATEAEVARILDPLEEEWSRLETMASDRGDQLAQEEQRIGLMAAIREANAKMDELEAKLADGTRGRDLRGVKELLKQKSHAEQEIQQLDVKLADIRGRAREMDGNGHFAAEELMEQVDQLLSRFQRLQSPLERRKAELEESLRWHQLAFDADVELQWIGEKLVGAQSQQLGRSLTDAQLLMKRQEQLSAELDCHQQRVADLLDTGKRLAKDGHICRVEIEQKCEELATAWAKLTGAVAKRRKHLSWALAREQLFFELAEADNWLTEKSRQLQGREEAAEEERGGAQTLLTWVRALQNELGPYRVGLAELGRKSAELVGQAPDEEDAAELTRRQAKTQSQADALEQRSRNAAEKADARLAMYGLMEEQQEMEEWLEVESREAAQEDCGTDLDQWTKLRAKFDERRQQIRLGQDRLDALEAEAGQLLERAPEYAREVLPRQNRLRAMWELLGDYMEQRDAALRQAEQIHRFWRDSEILEERIKEKKMALPNAELGKDAKQTYGLILKHEVFENELAQLHEELENLLNRATASGLDEGGQLRPLTEGWAKLREASMLRGQMLMANYETHKFTAQVRDLLQWTNGALAEMSGEQQVRDLQTAEWLAEEHRRLRAELEGRELERAELGRLGDELVEAGHCSAKDVAQRMDQMERAFAAVRKEWGLKADWLEQAVQWHAFQREALQILAQIQARNRAMDALEHRDGGGIDPASRQRELATLMRVLSQLEDRVSRLEESAGALTEQGHAEVEQIQALARRVMNALNELGEHANSVKRSLDAAEYLAHFEAEMAELLDWLKEKEDRLRVQQQQANNVGQAEQQRGTTLGEKLDRLKRQQALQSELAANGPRLDALKGQMEKLRRQRGPEAPKGISRCEQLLNRWSQFATQIRALDEALEEAKELLELEQLADRICAFVRAKEALVQAEETGEDLEHCQILLGRLDEDQSVDEATLAQTNVLGQKLLARGSAEAEHIRSRLGDINEGWERLSGRIRAYRTLLESALEVHRFNRDVDETNQRIGEKASLLASDELGKDLQTVERLLRAQDQVERDMSAIHRKLNEHDEQAKQLLGQEPPLRETVLDSLRKLELSWQKLAEMAHSRRQTLQQSLGLHRFLDGVRRMEQWAQTIRAKMGGGSKPRNVEEAERALQRHAERLAEIGARDDELRSLREFGQKLATEQPEHRSDLQRAQRRLQTLEHQTRQCWDLEQQGLERTLKLQKLLAQLGQIDCWLAGKQAQLDGLIPGESPESAEAAIRELSHFIMALGPQMAERLAQLDEAQRVLDVFGDDAEASRVGEKVAETREQCLELERQLEARKRLLNGAKHLAQFLRECAELMTWMNAKLQLAMDDGYLDATALRLKLQKHLAFDAELRASEERIERLKERGDTLVAKEVDFQDGGRVQAQMDELKTGWAELLAKSSEKAARLRHAYDAHQLNRRIVEMELWMERIESQIASEDHGTDIESAEQLLDQFRALRAEIDAKKMSLCELVESAAKLGDSELCDRAEMLQSRWEAMGEPCQIRAENLTEAVQFFRWVDQSDEHGEWLEAKVRTLESADYGKTLHAAQSLIQKHQILEKEFDVRQPGIHQLIGQGEKMLAELKEGGGGGGGRADELAERVGRLQELVALFNALASVRAQRLTESLHSQEFYAEAVEAEHWMRERLLPSLNHLAQPESGHAAETQLRRITGLEKEIETFGDQLKRLGEKCERMVCGDHFDLTGLQARHCQLQELFGQLNGQCRQRKAQIADAIRYLDFVRRADELLQWLRERLAVAEREDYGQDLEECEQLTQQFQQVVRELAGTGERVAQVLAQKEELLRGRHPNTGSIRAKGQDVQQLWREVNEAANERQQALMDGKNIHLFDQKADELLERLAEKEAHLLAMGDEQLGDSGMELAQVVGQLERHNTEFMHLLDVLGKQVDELCAEADRIVDAFPRTADHLEVRRGELVEQLKDVREGAERQAERLAQAQANHQYFQEFRELMAWARQMQATIQGELLPRDVAGSEALLSRHGEYKREIMAKEMEKLKFIKRGEQMLADQGNALGVEIRARIGALEETFADLMQCWHRRQQCYEDNADLQKWLATAAELERWLAEREELLREDWGTGALGQDGVEGVEHQIQHFDDFLATLDAQGPQFEALKRLTRVEQNWERIRGQEKRERERREQKEEQQPNRRETQPIRTLEKKKMLQEKRQERGRRKTQEISLMNTSSGHGGLSRHSGGHSMHSSAGSAHSGGGVGQFIEPPAQMMATSICSQTLPRASRGRANSSDGMVDGRLSIEIVDNGQGGEMGPPPIPVPRRAQPPQGRTPGFTTRRTQSIRRSRHWDDLRSVDIHGYLDRKQELQAGGKRATFRSWKGYYSILCGQLLCFFKDEQHFMENMAAAAPLALHGSHSALCPEYVKRRFVFRLNTADGAEFLFAASDQLKALEWVDKLNFRAQLDPADQLLAFRPTSSEPMSSHQQQGGHRHSQMERMEAARMCQTLEPRPKPRRMGEMLPMPAIQMPSTASSLGEFSGDIGRSATLDPRRMSNAKENDHLDEPDQKFLSRISVGEEETDEMDTVENGGQQNGHGRHGMIGKVVNGNNAKGEDTESIRSGRSKRSAFSFLRRSSAALGSNNNKKSSTTMADQ